MKILRTCPLTGKQNVREIDVTRTQLNAWRSGINLQDAMPHLSAEDRDFIKLGIDPQRYKEIMDDTE